MNKFIKNVTEFKFLTAMYFMGIVLCYMIIGLFIGAEAITLATLWQIILVSLIGAGMQYLFFISPVLEKMSQKTNAVIHFVLVYIILLGLSVGFNWFDVSNISYVVGLSGAYVVIYCAMFFAFYIYYKAQEVSYNNKLTEYKNKKDQ